MKQCAMRCTDCKRSFEKVLGYCKGSKTARRRIRFAETSPPMSLRRGVSAGSTIHPRTVEANRSRSSSESAVWSFKRVHFIQCVAIKPRTPTTTAESRRRRNCLVAAVDDDVDPREDIFFFVGAVEFEKRDSKRAQGPNKFKYPSMRSGGQEAWREVKKGSPRLLPNGTVGKIYKCIGKRRWHVTFQRPQDTSQSYGGCFVTYPGAVHRIMIADQAQRDYRKRNPQVETSGLWPRWRGDEA